MTPAAFGEAGESEVATVGWLVLGFVFDEAGRGLLIAAVAVKCRGETPSTIPRTCS